MQAHSKVEEAATRDLPVTLFAHKSEGGVESVWIRPFRNDRVSCFTLVVSITLTAIISGISGFYLNAFKPISISRILHHTPTFDSLITENTFSEIENAKALLDGATEHLLLELDMKYHIGNFSSNPRSEGIRNKKKSVN